MDILPPQTDLKVVRTRTFRLGPDGIVRLLRDLRQDRFTGDVTFNMSQGGLGPVTVRDANEVPGNGNGRNST